MNDKQPVPEKHRDEIEKYYREVGLGASAIQYVYRNLRYGKTLSRVLLTREDLELHTPRTFVHVDVPYERLKRFDHGGVGKHAPETLRDFKPQDGTSWGNLSPEMDFWLVPMIQEHLSAQNQVLIIEDNDSGISDPWLAEYPNAPVVTFENEVYFYLFQATAAWIRRVFSLANSWTLNVFLTAVPESETLTNRQRLTQEMIEHFADKCEKVVVGAYDREAFIVAQVASGF